MIVVVLVVVVLVLVVVVVVVVLVVVLLRYFHLHGKRIKVHGSSWYICLLAFVPMFGIYVVVDHRAYVSCRFWKPPRAEEVLPNFLMDSNLLPFYVGEGLVGGTQRPRSSSSALLVCLHRITSPLHRHATASLA